MEHLENVQNDRILRETLCQKKVGSLLFSYVSREFAEEKAEIREESFH